MSDQTSDRSSVAEGSTPSRETISRDEKLEHSTAPFTTSPIHEDDAELPPTDQPATGKQPVLKLDTNNLDENSRRPPEHKRSVSSDSFLDAYLNPSPVDNRSSWPKGNSPTSPPESADNPDYDQQKPREWGSEQLQTGSAAYPPHSTSVSAPPTAVAPPPGAVLPPSHHSVPLVSSSVPSPSIIPVPTASDAPEPSTSQALATPSVKEKPEKKSTWARLGLSRVTSSIKDDSNTPHSENEDASSAPSSATSSKGKKRGKKSSAPEGVEDTSKEKDKEGGSGFFGGLFSSSKRKGEQTEPPQQVLLPTSTGCFREGDFVNFYRLPIHVERAVYRLSHIKLANPKRALYEQVLISCVLFTRFSLQQLI